MMPPWEAMHKWSGVGNRLFLNICFWIATKKKNCMLNKKSHVHCVGHRLFSHTLWPCSLPISVLALLLASLSYLTQEPGASMPRKHACCSCLELARLLEHGLGFSWSSYLVTDVLPVCLPRPCFYRVRAGSWQHLLLTRNLESQLGI